MVMSPMSLYKELVIIPLTHNTMVCSVVAWAREGLIGGRSYCSVSTGGQAS